MPQLSLLSGVAASQAGEFLQRPPLNLEPVLIDTQISKGQLLMPPGVAHLVNGPGADRGGIIWRGEHYRVMGARLVKLTGSQLTDIGEVGGNGNVWFAYSFDRLAIGSNNRLYYWNGTALTQATDEDIGQVIDGIWIDGYFMLTDGTHIVVTELTDPASVLPLKYGSAEQDPDAIVGLLRYRDEAYVLGRHSIETFRNVGGNGFPFQTLKGAAVPFGCIGARAKTLFGDGFAFVGSGKDESLNVYLGGRGTAQAIGSAALCKALANEADPSKIVLESRLSKGKALLLMHLANEAWCYSLNMSAALGEPIWFRLQSKNGTYRMRHAVPDGSRIVVGDPTSSALGVLTENDARHFGEEVPWELFAGYIYNEARATILHEIELVGLTGRGSGPGVVFFSMTRDGQTFSQERAIKAEVGLPSRHLQWRPHVRFTTFLGVRFRGVGGLMPGIAAIEYQAEGLGA